jgi:polysaccharide pyruvyl transferase WcaK-like protein
MTNNSQLDILHIASFTGNVGDNANHNGTRKTLSENTSFRYHYTENEVRRYYQNYTENDELSFGNEFVRQANNHDLVIIGSGNFFELWIEESRTGTTIDIATERIEEISTPIVFYGLGCDPYKGIPGNNAKKFEQFLEFTLAQDHCLVSVRNDGSISHIQEYFGSTYADQVYKVPDGGFFTEVDNTYHPELDTDGPTMAVNVAKDMSDLRFPNNKEHPHSYRSFVSEFGEYINEVLAHHPDLTVVFMPHIYSDLGAISDVLTEIKNMNRRSRITTAPYLNGEGSERYIFDTYRQADLAIGMRFHTNVCSIGQYTPTIGLVSYPKVGDLYEELGLSERTVDLRQPGFSDMLSHKTASTLKNRSKIKSNYERIVGELEQDVRDFQNKINRLIKNGR